MTQRIEMLKKARTSLSLSSIVLVTTETTCVHCSRTYRSPSSILLQLDGPDGSVELASPQCNAFEYSLPQRKRTISLSIDACENCFATKANDHDQLDLFEQKRKLYALLHQPLSSKRGVIKKVERNDVVISELFAHYREERELAKRSPRKHKEAPKIVKTEDYF